VVLTIKRTIDWCKVQVRNVESAGTVLIENAKESSDISFKMTYLQIMFLGFYGVVWVLVVRGLGK
jgi:hypothetical protein